MNYINNYNNSLRKILCRRVDSIMPPSYAVNYRTNILNMNIMTDFRDHILKLNELYTLYSKYITFILESIVSISSSINVLHKNNYAHTDIKPENILIDIPRLESNIILDKIKQSHEKYTILKKKGKLKTIIPSLKNDCKNIINEANNISNNEKNL